MERKRDGDEGLSDPEDWVDRFGDYLYRYALVRLKDPARAEDRVQETFLSALQSRGSYKHLSSERTWLVGILRHKIIDDFRRLGREKKEDDLESVDLDRDPAFDENGKWKVGPLKWDGKADVILEQKQFWEVLGRCLSQLPTRLHRAFLLKEMEELSSKEICKILDITSTNLLVRMHRARRLLRDCLESNWFDVPAE